MLESQTNSRLLLTTSGLAYLSNTVEILLTEQPVKSVVKSYSHTIYENAIIWHIGCLSWCLKRDFGNPFYFRSLETSSTHVAEQVWTQIVPLQWLMKMTSLWYQFQICQMYLNWIPQTKISVFQVNINLPLLTALQHECDYLGVYVYIYIFHKAGFSSCNGHPWR